MNTYLNNILIGFDQLIHTLIGGKPDETISARAYREQWFLRHIINALFFDSNHCLEAYKSEKARKHLPFGY